MDYKTIVALDNDPEKLEALYQRNPATFLDALPEALVERPGSLLLRAWAERLLAEPPSEDVKPEPAPGRGPAPIPVADSAADPAVKPRDWVPWMIWGGICGVLMLLTVAMSISHSMGRTKGAGVLAIISTVPTAAYCLLILRWRGWPRNRTALVLGLLVLVFGYSYWLPLHGSLEKWILAGHHFEGTLFFLIGMCFVGERCLSVEDWKGYVRFTGDAFAFFLVSFGPFLLVSLIGSVLYAPLFREVTGPAFQLGLAAGVTGMFMATWAALQFRSWSLASRIFQLLTPMVVLLLVGFALARLGNGNQYGHVAESRIFMLAVFAVLCLAIFTVIGLARKQNRFIEYSLLAMVVLILLLGAPMLSRVLDASFSRRIDPKDLEVSGICLLWFVHLAAIVVGLFAKLLGRISMATVESITVFALPVYGAWLLFMAFVMPWLF